MAVEVRLFATLKEFLPGDSVDGVYYYPLSDTITIGQLATELKLPFVDLHLIMLNGQQASLEHQLKDGDRVGFFPPVGGG